MKRPWYKWFPADYMQDTRHLTLIQDAIYRRMLDCAWMNGGYLPQKRAEFERICMLKRGQKVVDILSQFWVEHEISVGSKKKRVYIQKRMKKEMDVYERKCAKNAENAKKGAEIRWQQDAERHSERHNNKMPNGIGTNMPNGTLENALIQKLEEKKEKRKKRKSPAGGLACSLDMTAKTKFNEARECYPGLKRGLDTEWENFRKKNRDYPAKVHVLLPAIIRQIDWREEGNRVGAFVPQWPSFSVWINQRRWETELPAHETAKQNAPLGEVY